MVLDQDALASSIYQTMFDGDIGAIPVVIHTMAAATNKAAALALVIDAMLATGELAPEPSSGVNQMMVDEIRCTEPWQTVQPAALADQRGSFEYQTDLESAQQWQFICPLIPKSAAAIGQEQPTVSTVPLLALNGVYDPIEQPRNWAGAQQLYPDSRDIALPGQGHDTNPTWDACVGPLTQAFIDQASLAHLDTSCLADIPAPVFDLTLP